MHVTCRLVVYSLLVIVTADQILSRWASSCFAAARLVPLPADLKDWARPVEDCASWRVAESWTDGQGGYNHLLLYS